MKPSFILIRIVAAAALIAMTASSTVRAQQQPNQPSPPSTFNDARLQTASLDRLASRATESVDVNIDEQLISLIPKALDPKDPEEMKARDVIAGLKGIYVRSYGFETEGAYAEADVAAIRAQLRQPGWMKIVSIVSKKEKEEKNIEVYVLARQGRFDGMAILSLEPKQVTFINIVGSIDLAKLRQLEGKFGIPEVGVGDEKGGQKN